MKGGKEVEESRNFKPSVAVIGKSLFSYNFESG